MHHITPEKITVLGDNEIFVFDDSMAQDALRWGFDPDQGFGWSGNAWLIPTEGVNGRICSLKQIEPFVEIFFVEAAKYPSIFYLVTPIGCGLSRYKPADIAPFFAAARNFDNVALPAGFWKELGMTHATALKLPSGLWLDMYAFPDMESAFAEKEKPSARFGARPDIHVRPL